MTETLLLPGTPAPRFHYRTTQNEKFAFDTVGGRHVVLCFFGVSTDPEDERSGRVADTGPAVAAE